MLKPHAVMVIYWRTIKGLAILCGMGPPGDTSIYMEESYILSVIAIPLQVYLKSCL